MQAKNDQDVIIEVSTPQCLHYRKTRLLLPWELAARIVSILAIQPHEFLLRQRKVNPGLFWR